MTNPWGRLSSFWRRLRAGDVPPPGLHEDDAAFLIAPLFDRVSSLLVAHAAPLFLCALVALEERGGWAAWFVAANIVLIVARARLVLSFRQLRDPGAEAVRRAARGYFAVGAAWALLTGALCFLCFVALDQPLFQLLAATLASGTAGGIASRNAAVPRFALLQVSAILVPQVAAAALLGGLYWVQAAQVCLYLAALCSVVRRHHRDLRRIMDVRREQAALAAHFDAALSNMSQGLTLYDGSGVLRVANARFRDLFGLPAESSLPGMREAEVDAELASRWGLEHTGEAARGGAAGRALVELPDGRSIALSREAMPDGGWVTTYEDVTERRRAEARVQQLAMHDVLTGLPNRALFGERLQGAVAGLHGCGSFAVLYLDLDRFKEVNDGLGHAVGDRLLVAVASRIRECLRPQDVAARLGGDEFAALLVGQVSAAEIAQVAERLGREVEAEYMIGGAAVSIGVSVGIAMAPRDGDTADLLLRHADMALYAAKGAGRGTYRFFDWSMSSRLQARRDAEADLRRALMREELELFYQPQITLGGPVAGFEALLRWRHPERGLMLPGEFMPVAEACNLVQPLGEWVLRTACTEAAGWPHPLRVSVNLSTALFAGRDAQAPILAALRCSGLDAARLDIEIKEALLLRNGEDVAEALRRIRALGVRVVLDDFGTGTSSIAMLGRFPLDKIKMDRSFVRDLPASESTVAIIRAIGTVASTLGLTMNAEGVETAPQLAQLRELGCTEVQGFLFSGPRPAREVPAMIRELARPSEHSGGRGSEKRERRRVRG